jgi:galactose mutarotase-like enzyme
VNTITLSDTRARAEIAVAEGGRVQHLVDLVSGRELLYQRTPPEVVLTDFATGCPGGWVELFPNDSPWSSHPDHGRLWSTSFDVLEHASRGVVLEAHLVDPPVRVVRCYELLDSTRRGLRIETNLRALGNTGPFLWASHPMLAVSEGWRIDLERDAVESDSELPGRFQPTTRLDEGQRERALIVPAPNQGWSEVLYASRSHQARVSSPDRSRTTRVAWDEDFLRHLWIVTISGELDLDLCLLFEPCTSRPYRLEEAVDLGEAVSLGEGEERAWWTEVESLDAVA